MSVTAFPVNVAPPAARPKAVDNVSVVFSATEVVATVVVAPYPAAGTSSARKRLSQRFTMRADHLAIPARAVFRRALLGAVIHMHNAESLGLTKRPFHVVHEGPLRHLKVRGRHRHDIIVSLRVKTTNHPCTFRCSFIVSTHFLGHLRLHCVLGTSQCAPGTQGEGSLSMGWDVTPQGTPGFQSKGDINLGTSTQH